MAKPSKSQVSTDLKRILSIFSKLPVEEILDRDVLTKPPLHFDNTSLNFLTLSVRGYIKQKGSSKSILAAEIKKTDLTVSGLIDVAYSKF